MSQDPTHHQFQAEVKQLLDIVIHSLYTDKEIFIRELVSNASDALEKLRHLQQTERNVFEADRPLEIHVTTDEEAKTLTISDSGIGMTRAELVENLGTIAHSGTKAFLKSLEESKRADAQVIGQFGVGFYSAFMAATEVTVYTHSWRLEGEDLQWTSDAANGYRIEDAPGQARGCKIVLKLKEDCEEYAKPWKVRQVLENYSNFVGFPVLLNGERVNKVEAIWLKSKGEVSDEQYADFYKFVAHAYDEPRYRLHFNADAPLTINALLFAPQENPEMMGMGQIQPGVALYCRKVLIDAHPAKLLPDWLRFLKGVIDSADLPLNISRESMQDSALIKKLNDVITKRFIKFLDGEAKGDADKYQDFYTKFSRFIKEGICTDYQHRDALGKLLRYESSMTEKGKSVGLEDYIARMKPDQTAIYYQASPNREAVEAGPYLEAFAQRGIEVIFMFEPIDEYVLGALTEFDGKKLVAVDSTQVELPDEPAPEGESLSPEEATALCEWVKEALGDRVQEVREGKRLVSSPAMSIRAADAISPHLRQMMKAMNQEAPMDEKTHLELNPRHDLIRKLAAAKDSRPELARLVVEQIHENSLLGAGLLEDPRETVTRVYKIMEAALN